MTIRVAVSSKGKDLITPMATMRDWLDCHSVASEKFVYETADGAITFYLDFALEAEANAFAAAFGAEVLLADHDRAA
jgi:hypothetical protein